ncbi:MAG: hypothetical protein E7284_01110 [Lachnospiraceae bacterium]|nr:hypothetical protein [Lachnospiraceae bacterium]
MESNLEDTTYINENKEVTEKKDATKTRRVGTISVGLSMVVFGIMFLLCSVFGILSYRTVFAMWPAILVVLGLEILIYSFWKGKLVYDKGSVFIMILMLFLSAGMAAADVFFKLADYYMTIHL